jgi:pyruvate formate lyase activating enzyme
MHEFPPAEVVKRAKAEGCLSISYTYNEPTVFFEYALDCAKLARKAGLKNVLVTNGFINEEPATLFAKHMDAANVDLKGFDEDFYRMVCKARLEPVLRTLKIYHAKLWLEITNLIIDGKNDDMAKIEEMCIWIKENLSRSVPLHFSRAFPMYRMMDIKPTPKKTLDQAYNIARKHLDFVYVGNTGKESDTICPVCKRAVIRRRGYCVDSSQKEGKCGCGAMLPGLF